MKNPRTYLVAAAFATLCALTADARADGNIPPPELPDACQDLEALPGNEVAFRVYAIGVQVYRWNGASWDFVGPDANLYADPNFRGKVGTHYGGPTWQTNSGSYVVGRVAASCTVDPSAVKWLLLERRTSEGPGVLGDVTFIQRVNTAGGVGPTEPGSFVNEEKRVPYTTEYYFYRPQSW
jgi:hypothetical protein